MPPPYEFDLLHADGIRHADLDAGERVLNEMILEYHESLEGIANAVINQEARGVGVERLTSHGGLGAVPGLLRHPLA